jgi:hypothetical protein
MQHRIAIMAIAAGAVIIAACADQSGGTRLATEPGDTNPVARYVTSGSAAVVNPKTHRLETVSAEPGRGGVSASIVGGTSTDEGMQIASNAPGVASTGGRASWSFIDDAKHVQKIVMLYRSGGGPPAAVQHYTDGALVSTTALAWAKTSTGWVRTRSYLQVVRGGALAGTYTTTSVPAPPSQSGGPIQTVRLDRAPAVSPVQRALGSIAYALAFTFAPQDATAQGFYFYSCRQEWLRYAAAAAVLAGASAAIAAAPEFTPALMTGFAAALATTAALEDVLIDCMLRYDSVSSGGFSGGGAASWPTGKWDCFEGSYAAHCTTAFTL